MTSFTEALHLELRGIGSNVVVQALCPGFTYSEFHDVIGLDRDRLAIYLHDVCGHGMSASLLSIAVFNMLRRQSLPDVHFHEPETIYVVPIKSDSEHFPIDGKLRVYSSRTGGNEWEPLTKVLPQKDCYVNILRDAMAVDSLDKCGVYFGTTGGQVYGSADGGDHWDAIVSNFPAVLSVEVQTLS